MNFKESCHLQNLPEQYYAQILNEIKLHKDSNEKNVINLSQGNPDISVPSPIKNVMIEEVKKPDNDRYPPFRGLKDLKESIAKYYLDNHNVYLDPDTEVAVLNGGKTSIYQFCLGTLNPGDSVILPDPYYPDYLSGLSLVGANIKKTPLLRENGFLPEYQDIEEQTLKECKFLFLNYPNNPTAAVATPTFFEETVSLANTHKMGVFHDFAYGTMGTRDKLPISFLETKGAKDVGVELFTVSKAFSMAGWRLSFVLGNNQIVEAINKTQDHLFTGVYAPIQKSVSFALKHSKDISSEITSVYNKRRYYFINELEKLGVDYFIPQGTFYVWISIDHKFNSSFEFFHQLLKEYSVAVCPGEGFGDRGKGYIRVSLTDDVKKLKFAAQSIAALIKNRQN